MRYVFGILFIFFALSGHASGVFNGLTYQGRIIKPNNLPLEASSVTFRLQVRSPEANNCVLYEESHTLDMRNTGGVFSLTLGSGTRSGNDPGLNFKDVFSNAVNFAGPLVCEDGNSYNPASGHSRKLRVTFNEGNGPIALTPDLNIQSVPYAFYAEKLQGKSADDLLQVSSGDNLSQSNLQNVFTGTNYTDLMDLITGNSAKFVKSSPNISVGFNNQRLTDLADPTSAQDAATKNYTDMHLGGKDLDDSDIGPALGDGKVLTWDAAGGKWVAEDPPSGADNLGNHTATTDLNMAGNKIINLDEPTTAADAVTKNYVDTKFITRNLPAAPGVGQNDMSIKYDHGSGAWVYYTPISAGADNLGDHTATENIVLGPNWISGDGDNEGIYIAADGKAGIGTDSPSKKLDVAGNLTFGSSASTSNTFSYKSMDTGGDFTWLTTSVQSPGVDNRSNMFINAERILSIRGGNGANISIGTGGQTGGIYNDAFNQWTVESGGNTRIPLTVRGKVSQSVDVFRVLDGSSNPLLNVNSAGSTGVGTASPHASALLEVSSTTKGLLLPRMTTAERDAIASPATGLQIYNTSDNKLQFYNGSAWNDVGSGTASVASQVSNTPAGNISATTIQAAINELDNEKVAKAGDTMTGPLAMSTNKITGLGDPTDAQDAATKNYLDSNFAAAVRTVTAGAGLTGGGDLSVDRTFNVGAGTGIIVNANDVAVNIGTGANQIVQLDGSSRLPAVDGSQLTNITGTDNTKVAKAGDTMTGTLNLQANGLVAGTNQLVLSGGSVGIGTAAPDSSSLLEVSSVTKGLLPPRMDVTQRDAISNPATGLTIYNTTSGGLEVFNGSSWTLAGATIPTGAIMVFASATCPSGWTEYTPARGRFLRGIDNGAGNDPDGTRAPGAVQNDAFQGHHHNVYDNYGGGLDNNPYWHQGSASMGAGYTRNTTPNGWGWKAKEAIADESGNGTPRVGPETRPKNVAVLYCQYSGAGGSPPPGANQISQDNSSIIVTDSGTNGTITLSTEGSSRLHIDPTGKVGIGTTNPQAKLHVNGEILGAAKDVGGGARKICSGQTAAGAGWQVYNAEGIYLDIDTSGCGFTTAPIYTSSIGGSGGHWQTTGGSAIYAPTATSFRIYVRWAGGGAVDPAYAAGSNWHINWHAIGY